MLVVYIASPYTMGDVAQNVKKQLDAADELMSMGFCPIVPLLTHFQHLHKPRPYDDWMSIDMEKVRRCDVLLRLPGESSGADREVMLAESIGIPVVFSMKELRESNIKELAVQPTTNASGH
jgi:hypothetical protein